MSSSSSSSSILFSSSSSSSSLTSVSSSSSSSSSSTLSSSLSSLSSSSSSIDSSSSSSSSYLDLNDERYLPFTFNIASLKYVWGIASYGNTKYAGTSRNGMVIRSVNNFYWEDFYRADDIHASAVFVKGKYLYIGTSPRGKVYRIDLTDKTSKFYDTYSGTVVDFVSFQNNLFFVTSEPSCLYKYNSEYDQWDVFYQPYASRINQIRVLGSKFYLCMEESNIIAYNGTSWESVGNISFYSNHRIKKSPFYYPEASFIDVDGHVKTNSWDDEKKYNVFPMNRTEGVSCIDMRGDSLIIGSSNAGRIYGLENNSMFLLWDTEGKQVHDLINIDSSSALAGIEDKLYLLYSGQLVDEESSSGDEVSSSSFETTDDKSIIVTSPNGGEVFSLGDDMLIQWSSTRGVNDAVKISLYDSGELTTVINQKTLNSGSYTWTIPLSIDTGSDYKIEVKWLSAGETSDSDKDMSDEPFSLLTELPSSSSSQDVVSQDTSTSTLLPCRGIPLYEFMNGEHVVSLDKDDELGIVLTTSQGRIISFDTASLNAYKTGERTIYASVENGFGRWSEDAQKNFMYGLVNRILSIDSDRKQVNSHYVENASSISCEKIKGVFTSPIIEVKEDIGFWKQLSWQEQKPENTQITICIRSSDSAEGILNTPWSFCYSYDGFGTNTVTESLNNIPLSGGYIQIKAEMTSAKNSVSPVVSSIAMTYSTKRAYYFYTVKFSLDNADLKNGILVANTSEPTNTKVEFGICNTDSSKWEDYDPVNVDELFNISDFSNIKIGARLVSYGTASPELSEFVLLSGDSTKQVINND